MKLGESKKFGAALFLGVLLFAGSAQAESFDCDGLMMGLMKQNGGCPTGTCNYNIVNGRLLGFNGASVIKDDLSTSMKSITSATKDANGLLAAQIDTGKDGAIRMRLSVIDDKGQTTKSEFGLTAKDGSCIHEQTERKNPTNTMMSVDYDREFCAAAAGAYEGLDDAQAKSCDNILKNLIGKYEERSNALANDGKKFRMASVGGAVAAKARSIVGDEKAAQSRLVEALKQKDQCARASTEVERARPLEMKAYLKRVFEPGLIYGEYVSKRAFPLDRKNLETLEKKFRERGSVK